MNELYQELIIDHGTNPRNFVVLENANFEADAYNPLCGDQIKLFLLVKDQKIIQATFQGHGCAISTASASIMTELLVNKNILDALKLYKNFINILTNDFKNDINLNVQFPTINHDLSSNVDEQLPKKLLALLGVKNYPARVKCATLAWHTLDSALNEKIERS